MRILLIVLLLCATASRLGAQGGPPFFTDDPGTPGNRNWEINLGLAGTHTPGGGDYDVPNFDFNYGLGERMQLKYEIPISAATGEHNITRAGLGNSLAGIKIRPYEHRQPAAQASEDSVNFSIGTYPQVLVSNPTRSVQRGVAEPGPQYYLPLQATAKLGPVALNGEVGRWFGNRHVPSRIASGLIAGHVFSERLELFAEVYNLQDTERIGTEARQHSLTLDAGGRRALDANGHIRLLFMGGRSLRQTSRTNGEPDWIAYLGLQFQLQPKKEKR